MRLLDIAAAIIATAGAAAAAPRRPAPPWTFEHAYPKQLAAARAAAPPAIDGALDDACWADARWSRGAFEDIAQPLFPNATIPDAYQTDVAACWDDDYLYVAAVLGETNGWATVFGDNENLTDGRAPWWDPDFEIFVNAARTTHGYVEFETNANNATYDVLWRVPQQGFDSVGVPCAPGAATWCGNSSFNGGNQTWSLSPSVKVAAAAPTAFDPLAASKNQWVVEVRLPLRGSRGGLLDGGGPAPAPGIFWYADFARAEHPLPRTGAAALSLDFSTPAYAAFCADMLETHPTLLGASEWSCYWEWTWQNLAATRYMHNPDLWGYLYFTDGAGDGDDGACRDPEWPLRYVLFNAWRAMVFAFIADGAYPVTFAELGAHPACNATASCDAAALRTAASSDVFDASVSFGDGACASYAPRAVTGGQCFFVNASFADPDTGFAARGVARTDRFTTVDVVDGAGSCL